MSLNINGGFNAKATYEDCTFIFNSNGICPGTDGRDIIGYWDEDIIKPSNNDGLINSEPEITADNVHNNKPIAQHIEEVERLTSKYAKQICQKYKISAIDGNKLTVCQGDENGIYFPCDEQIFYYRRGRSRNNYR